MGHYVVSAGVWKDCPECGKPFPVGDVGNYAYKRYVSDNSVSHIAYFCSWSCLRKFDKRYEEEKKKKKSEAAKRGHKKRKAMRDVGS